ncbi:MAG TPA: polysaccharide deacetylase family protein [Rhodanobacteraceae bacterium]
MRIALKVDVDTLRGTREGVPALMTLFQRLHVPATFLFSVGPDHTGRALRRLLRPGFLAKVLRTSVPSTYGLKTLAYGTLLPGPDIGRKASEPMRAAQAAGFEVGLHAWDHVRWQDAVARKNATWTERDWRRGTEAFESIFGAAPTCCGAAGWQINDHVLTLETQANMRWASDTRGGPPFRPRLVDGIGCPQIPTTLPTMDELIGCDGVTTDNVGARLIDMVQHDPRPLHVFTLHAELEGGPLLGQFEQALRGWQALGTELVTVGEAVAMLDIATLPIADVVSGRMPGRAGTLATSRFRSPTHTVQQVGGGASP